MTHISDQGYLRRYAHCEYGNGFIVFDHMEGTKEVWRHSTDYTAEEAALVIPESKPAPRQLQVFAAAEKAYGSTTTLTSETPESEQSTPPPQRGHFRPWALLRPPHGMRAFRLSYPILGSTSRNTIYLWDVRTGALVQQIDDIQKLNSDNIYNSQDLLGEINYIEVGEKYVIVCGRLALRVFERGESGNGKVKGSDERGRCVMSVSPRYTPKWRMTIDLGSQWRRVDGAEVVERGVVDGFAMPGILDLGREFRAGELLKVGCSYIFL